MNQKTFPLILVTFGLGMLTALAFIAPTMIDKALEEEHKQQLQWSLEGYNTQCKNNNLELSDICYDWLKALKNNGVDVK